jgi:hypothetical protein
MKIPISEFYNRLDAPLTNVQWSWGAKTKDGTTVILRGWQHQMRKVDGKYQFLVLDHAWQITSPLGYNECLQHLSDIRNGVAIRIISMEVKDATQRIWQIKQCKSDALMIGTRIVEEGELTYIEVDGIEKLHNGRRIK